MLLLYEEHDDVDDCDIVDGPADQPGLVEVSPNLPDLEADLDAPQKEDNLAWTEKIGNSDYFLFECISRPTLSQCLYLLSHSHFTLMCEILFGIDENPFHICEIVKQPHFQSQECLDQVYPF